MIRLGNRKKVQITESNAEGCAVYTVDNGHSQFSIAPDFAGALIGWKQDGVNHLLSPFPDQKTFGWMSPWYGGVTPIVMQGESGWDLPGKFHQEKIETTVIEQSDERGIVWQGVRINAEIEREQLVGLGIEFEYLTVGNSNLLKLVCRVHNRTTAKRRVSVGWLSYWQLDGASTGNTLRSQEIERKHTPWDSWPEAGHWGALTHPETERTAMMVSRYPDVKLIDWGDVGGHLGCFGSVDVMPTYTSRAQPTERTCYIALCNSWEQAHVYTCLDKYL
jgi:hypothetical protein